MQYSLTLIPFMHFTIGWTSAKTTFSAKDLLFWTKKCNFDGKNSSPKMPLLHFCDQGYRCSYRCESCDITPLINDRITFEIWQKFAFFTGFFFDSIYKYWFRLSKVGVFVSVVHFWPRNSSKTQHFWHMICTYLNKILSFIKDMTSQWYGLLYPWL